MTTHPYRLRPYHNPISLDESAVPAGWRFPYQGESIQGKIIIYFSSWITCASIWSKPVAYKGPANASLVSFTFIVPVNETTNTTER